MSPAHLPVLYTVPYHCSSGFSAAPHDNRRIGTGGKLTARDSPAIMAEYHYLPEPVTGSCFCQVMLSAFSGGQQSRAFERPPVAKREADAVFTAKPPDHWLFMPVMLEKYKINHHQAALV